tara:strand:- start:1998 stop:2297 length:300 start_codon:yes stop_codon:yes gene_type:complete
MNSKITALKEQIKQHKAARGPKAKIPNEVWSQLADLSKSQPLPEICAQIGLDLNNARAKLKKLNKASSPAPSFIQLSTSLTPIMEISLKSGTVIKVFDQ